MEPNPNNGPPSNAPRWSLTYQDTVYAIMAVQAVTGHDFSITHDHINWALQLDSRMGNGISETLQLRIPRYHLRSRIVFDHPVLDRNLAANHSAPPGSPPSNNIQGPEYMVDQANAVFNPPTQGLAPGSVPNLNPLQALAESAATVSRLGRHSSLSADLSAARACHCARHLDARAFVTADGGNRPLSPSVITCQMANAHSPPFLSGSTENGIDTNGNNPGSSSGGRDASDEAKDHGAKHIDENHASNSGEEKADDNNNNDDSDDSDDEDDFDYWSLKRQIEVLGESMEDYLEH